MTSKALSKCWRTAIVALSCVGGIATGFSAEVEVDVRDGEGKPIAGAVVFLDSPAAKQQVRPLVGAEVAQEKKKFLPGTMVITTGTEVRFPNHDAVRHHVYSFSPAKKFELKLYKGTPSTPVLFDQSGVVLLGCNIHDNMVGWILVVDTPYYATSDASGRGNLSGVPAGKYQLRVWHPGMDVGAPAHEQALAVAATGSNAAMVTLVGLTP